MPRFDIFANQLKEQKSHICPGKALSRFFSFSRF